MLYFALITLLIAKKYVFSSGGSEKNRLITAADVRTGDLLPSRMCNTDGVITRTGVRGASCP